MRGQNYHPRELEQAASAKFKAADPPDRFAIESWMVQWLAFQLKMSEEEIDPRHPFGAHGLDSLAAVQLSQALEDWLAVPVAETVFWSYPTPADLSAHLDKELRKRAPSVPATRDAEPSAPGSEADRVLQWVERLSDSQVENLFRSRVGKE